MATTDLAAGSAEDARLEDRREKVWALRMRGLSSRQIAKHVEVSHVTVLKDLTIVLDRTRSETNDAVAQHRSLQLSRLERLTEVLMPLAESGSLDAIDRLDKIEKRRAALLGLDAPTKVSTEISTVSLDELEELRSAAKANACNPQPDEPTTTDENGPSS